jgi:hypothetical protein
MTARGTWQGSGTWQTTGGGGGGLVLAVIAAAVLLSSGAASAIASALVTILIIVAVVVVLAVAGVTVLLARRERPVITARPVYQLPPEPRPQLEASQRPAIGPGREVHLHLNVTPDQLAAILRHHTEEDR